MSFIPKAFADTAINTTAHSAYTSFMSFLPMIIIFILFWFLLIRPQQKKAKLHGKMVAELQRGDEIITNGGIVGKIEKIEEQFIHLEIAEKVIIMVQRSTISTKLEKSILKI